MKNNKNNFRILVINPGSTSTKIAIYNNIQEKHSKIITHTKEELNSFKSISKQKDFRLSHIHTFLNENNIDKLDTIIGRGGLIHPVKSGVYHITKEMLVDLETEKYGSHASNLGAILSHHLSLEYLCSAFIADPVIVDEMQPKSRISGIPSIERKSIFHALNQKAVAREIAKTIGKPYEKCKLIIAHCGGGISVGAHYNGKVIDVNNALDGDGPFSPERSGGLPVGNLSKLANNHKGSFDSFKKTLVGNAGLLAYCGTNNLSEILEKVNNRDKNATLVYEAMIFQISKEIAMHGATLKGNIDAIVITGGMAHNKTFVNDIKKHVSFLSSIYVIPGELEMHALASYAYDVLRNECKVLSYY